MLSTQIFGAMVKQQVAALYESYEAAKILDVHEHIFNLRGQEPGTCEEFSELMTGTMRDMHYVGVASMHAGCPLYFLNRISQSLKLEMDLTSITKGSANCAKDMVGYEHASKRDLMRLLMDGMNGVSEGFSNAETSNYFKVFNRGVSDMAKKRGVSASGQSKWLRWEGVQPMEEEFVGVGKGGPPAPYTAEDSPRKRKRDDAAGGGDDEEDDE